MTKGDRPIGQQVVFASNALPPHLDDKARRDRFHETFEQLICGADITFPADQPFFMSHRFARANDIRVGQTEGTISHIARGARAIARHPDDDLFAIFNYGPSRIRVSQMGKETDLSKEGSILLSHGETIDFHVEGRGDWIGVVVPRERLCAAVTGAEDMIAEPFSERRSVGRLLASYAEALLDLDAADYDAALARHVSTTIVDLLTLLLGAEREATEVARLRGLRAARLQEILAKIKSGFTNPNFSSADVATRLGLSQRYINKLLFESGQSFAERVLELRLQKARSMLSDPRHDHLKVSDIALACGFNEVSYFNRRFRARFGCSPTACRGGGNLV